MAAVNCQKETAYGKGTVSSEIADMFGVGSVDKSVLIITMLPKVFADKMLLKFQHRLLDIPNSGVAFTLSLSGNSVRIVHILKALEQDSQEREQEWR